MKGVVESELLFPSRDNPHRLSPENIDREF